MSTLSRGFRGRRERPGAGLPPGQYLAQDVPVLSAGPTPAIDLWDWELAITTKTRDRQGWDWAGFQALPSEPVTVDLHGVTHCPNSTPAGRGVAGHPARGGGHQRRLRPGHLLWRRQHQPALEDLADGKAWVAFGYDGQDLAAEHGGPARLLVPHLSLWKSAKWVHRIQLLDPDEPGFWERLGDHNDGDPWQEQRFWGD